jgi:hypothetical protein
VNHRFLSCKQTLLAYCADAQTVAAARLVSTIWRQASLHAAINLKLPLSGESAIALEKLRSLHKVTTC